MLVKGIKELYRYLIQRCGLGVDLSKFHNCQRARDRPPIISDNYLISCSHGFHQAVFGPTRYCMES